MGLRLGVGDADGNWRFISSPDHRVGVGTGSNTPGIGRERPLDLEAEALIQPDGRCVGRVDLQFEPSEVVPVAARSIGDIIIVPMRWRWNASSIPVRSEPVCALRRVSRASDAMPTT